MSDNQRTRFRRYFVQRNYKFETHDSEGNLTSEISEDEWKEQVITELFSVGAEEMTGIFHDRDVDTEGHMKALHCHFVLSFKNARDYEATRKACHAEDRNFQDLKSEASGMLYLTHTTSEAIKAKKTRYNVDELIVYLNNEFEALEGEALQVYYRNKIAGKTGESNVKKSKLDDVIAELINDLSSGLLALDEIKDILIERFDSTTATLAYMRNKRFFKEAVKEYYEAKFQEWRENGRNFHLIFINGSSGVGKTRFANKLGREINRLNDRKLSDIHFAPNHSRKTRFDFLSSYDNEAITIFDDLDSESFSYNEFLNLFESERVAKYSSRFYDKAWFAEYAIITKSQSIESWTLSTSYSELIQRNYEQKQNVLYQIRRRFSLVITIEDDCVKLQKYVKVDKNNKHSLKDIEVLQIEDNFQNKDFQAMLINKCLEQLALKIPDSLTDEDILGVDEDESSLREKSDYETIQK